MESEEQVQPEALRLPMSESCFVCGCDNHRGLHIRFRKVGDAVEADLELLEDYRGFGDRAHGGIVATLLDEVMGWATTLAFSRFTYTVELTTRYRHPVPVQEPLRIVGRVTRANRRLCFAEAELECRGELLASATGKFMPIPDDENRRVADSLIYEEGGWRPTRQ